MVYLIGYDHKAKKDIWAGKHDCPNCGQTSNFHLHKVKYRGFVFFIPVISITEKRLFVCDSCQAGKVLSDKEYNDIKNSQKIKMGKGEFPVDVITKDFHPKEVKLGRKVFLLILTMLLGFIMTYSAISITAEITPWDASVPFVVLFMLAIGLLPLAFAIRSTVIALRKRKIYLSTTKAR